MKFNIIFTPGIVKYLRLFTLSLLKYSSCSFRLISNGCSQEEDVMLTSFCEIDTKLEYYKLPFEGLVEHSVAITHLQGIEDGDYFCFMDPDIIASGDFIVQFKPLLEQYSGVFSGTVIWLDKAGQTLSHTEKIMGGRFNITEYGLCLGSTFFAIYNNKILSNYLENTLITFDKYNSWENIPTDCQAKLIQSNLKMQRYDTAKVLNILMQRDGEKFIFRHSHHLYHIGGLSSLLVGPLSKVKQRGFIRGLNKISSRKYLKQIITRRSITQTKYIRRDVADYFTTILKALFEGKKLPPKFRIQDQKISQDMETARQLIVQMFDEYHHLLNL